MVLTGAGLLLQSLAHLRRTSPGFDARHVWTSSGDIPVPRYRDAAAISTLAQKIVTALASSHGIEAAGAMSYTPLSGRFQTVEYRSDDDAARQAPARPCDQRTITPGLFAALGTRIIAGRDFRWEDNVPQRNVVIVDARLARAAWPGQDPIGKRLELRLGATPRQLEVIGVAEHVRYDNLAAEGREQLYVLTPSAPSWTMSMVLRTPLARAEASAALTSEMRKIDPELAMSPLRSMDSYVEESIAPARLATILMTGFAAMSALLAAIGLYAVVSYSVTLRRKELGIRAALGADRGATTAMVLRQGMTMAGAGIAIGLAGTLGLRRLLSGLVEGVGAVPLALLGAIAIGAVAIMMAACWIPARRAAQLDPAAVLKE
jgi:predicted permease